LLPKRLRIPSRKSRFKKQRKMIRKLWIKRRRKVPRIESKRSKFKSRPRKRVRRKKLTSLRSTRFSTITRTSTKTSLKSNQFRKMPIDKPQ
jgi:hypothetical protein